MNDRSFEYIIKGIFIRIISLIIPFTFPAFITTFLHRLRGVNIGKGSKISRSAIIDDGYPNHIYIGDKVWVTGRVIILCHQRNYEQYLPGMSAMDCPIIIKNVKIKDGAHIGMGAIILPGVTIGKGAIIGAGAVVTSDVPDYSIAVGVPAKVVRKFI